MEFNNVGISLARLFGGRRGSPNIPGGVKMALLLAVLCSLPAEFVMAETDPTSAPAVQPQPDGSPKYTNRLIDENSPYLLQHAHNPVNWYPWGDAAFARARAENKPIFLSIGYATCHWCHVMERESFEDADVAAYLNEYFVAIKVDRERRPDIDAIYMTAVQLITGGGGWPMSSFLTPQGETFFGGTYFPKEQFLALLQRVQAVWSADRAGVMRQAREIAGQVRALNQTAMAAGAVDELAVSRALASLQGLHDRRFGGYGSAPKFPQEARYLFLLDQFARSADPDLGQQLCNDLLAMARGGIYDQVGGGFHRYATDARWRIPHFEKMLYNQAQMATLYARAAELFGDRQLARVARQTLDYVLRDMSAADGVFYSASDADSDGAEGRFFVWTQSQLRAVLPADDAALAIALYGVTDKGNFEGANILYLPLSLTAFARQHGMTLPALQQRVDAIRTTLYQQRERRVHPATDEKIVTAWNGMMIVALAEAAQRLHEPRYMVAAVRAAQSLWRSQLGDDGRLWRVRLADRVAITGQQSDYAWLASASIALYDLTQDAIWLQRAQALVQTMNEQFADRQHGGYFMSATTDELAQPMVRPKDSVDGAEPSGNAVSLQVLAKLHLRSENVAYQREANSLLAAFAPAINRSPAAYAAMLYGEQVLTQGESGPRQYAAHGALQVAAQAHEDRIEVTLTLRDGWHVNGHRPLQKELIATVLQVTAAVPGWRFGPVHYPAAEQTLLALQDEPMALYHRRVMLSVPLQRVDAPSAPSAPAALLPLQLQLQACDDSHCLPPERLSLTVPLPGKRSEEWTEPLAESPGP